MNKELLKSQVAKVIEKEHTYLQTLADKLFKIPEMGYKEKKTSSLLKQEFLKLGIRIDTEDVALTGFKCSIKGNRAGSKLAVLGELDSIICYQHPCADKNTGAVHACGHFAQLVSMLAVAIGLKKADIMQHLSGEICFMAVPAEEFIELDYRQSLVEQGIIKYKSGKQQAIWEGHFDDIDIALMNHVISNDYPFKAYAGMTSNSFVSKRVTFMGCEAHAGAEPHKGVNALNMAMLALNNINALRETFHQEDTVRVHSIIIEGGDAVNVIPSETVMETVVRGASLEVVKTTAKKIDKCIIAAAMAVGGEVTIKDDAGYLPLVNEASLMSLYAQNISNFLDKNQVATLGKITASFDFGDLTFLKPGLHSFIAAADGSLHSKEFRIQDTKLAYVTAAQGLAFTIIDLLFDDSRLAKQISMNYQPQMDKETYLQYLEENSKTFKSDLRNMVF